MIHCVNIEQETLNNTEIRKILNTSKHQQLVVMHIPVGGDIPMEVHYHVDQFIRIESGKGKAVTDYGDYHLSDGMAITIPSGTTHQIINTGDVPLKIYTIYSPPEHHHDDLVLMSISDLF